MNSIILSETFVEVLAPGQIRAHMSTGEVYGPMEVTHRDMATLYVNLDEEDLVDLVEFLEDHGMLADWN
tara:strand:+ start:28260 stop:28466 length:207 start_codon:yes stop_codon:yes gene_type:complete